MKKCPQCHSVYSFDTNFCLNDGVPLGEDSFQIPTQVFQAEQETIVNKKPVFIPPPIPNKETKRGAGFGKSFLFLIIGLILGGVLVLGILFAIISNMKKREPASNNANVNSGEYVADNIHKKLNKTRKDSEFNGYVLSENANLRSAPNSSSMGILPQNDRLEILEREGTWYKVRCEHGSSGWMHGNTIRFNDDEIPF
jgi:hypothetical protein